ncbi:hypothetical protein ABH920_007862 [Catenulispora sp. EB89]|uniref:LmbU family transcriptional regulator n=1 Tax=Catenulispora sp. EB89 TaxID=3156257 RepID=UPI0035161F32
MMDNAVRGVAAGARTANPERLSLDPSTVTRRTSLTLRAGLTVDEWLRVGLQISRVSESSTWWLGDWLVYGRQRYPDRYRQAVESTSLDYQTLRNYAWVAGKIGVERRRSALSFQHHAQVAPLPEPAQDAWLEKAERHGWSRNRLRAELKAAAADPGSEARMVQLRLEGEQLSRWRQAAEREGRDLLSWMTQGLDEAAGLAEPDPVPALPPAPAPQGVAIGSGAAL